MTSLPLRSRVLSADLVMVCVLMCAPVYGQTVKRAIAVTFDDLPASSAGEMNAAGITEMNRKLLAALTAGQVPAIGFVNEERLYKTGEVDARIAVLSAWLDSGFDLGNHTFSHTSLNRAELRDWEDDVVQGESVTRMLLQAHGKKLRYLRHPYLDTGPDLGTRRQAEAFLTARGYRVAPVTIDALDWYFADVYQVAREHANGAASAAIVEAWLTYTAEVLSHYESMSRALLGYEPTQVLLLHDTWLEADHLPELLAVLRRRGYQLVSLDEALADPAYAQPDEYISDVGASWIDHWAITRGRPEACQGKPLVPAWIQGKHQDLRTDADQSK